MTNGRSVFVLLNPAAGRGRRAARLDHYFDLLARALPAFDHAWTQAAGDEVKLVDKALAEGCDTIVAVGGDGTWSLVADRILQSGRRDVALGLLPTGTGNDFGKSLGVRHEPRVGHPKSRDIRPVLVQHGMRRPRHNRTGYVTAPSRKGLDAPIEHFWKTSKV